MKILLDECLPRRFGAFLIGHEVKTVTQAGWAGIKNGQLLSRAQGEFDVFLTIDQSLVHQQNITSFKIGILVLKSHSNDVDLLRPLVPSVLDALAVGSFTGVKFVVL